MSEKLNIGLFGFGVVGQGLYDIIKTKQLDLEIVEIAIKDEGKQRSLPSNLFTTNQDELLNNPEINTIVELINDTDAAFGIVSRALCSGKNVVSASKKMIAHYLSELIALTQKHGTSLLYEGAVCGSIPIIRNLEEYYDNEMLHSVSGIFNGSSNYILSKGFNENMDYHTALKKAQDLGFAETDPTSDVGGFDAKYKLVILAAHAFGVIVAPDQVFNLGIQNLSEHDLQHARKNNLKIKLVPVAKELGEGRLALFVLPKFVNKKELLYNVEYEYNGVIIEAYFADQQFFFGKGAGGHPTGSAVLSDITALRCGYKYEYKKAKEGVNLSFTNNLELNIYIRYQDKSLIESLNFTEIHECYYSNGYKFVIGQINLQNLMNCQRLLINDKAFVACTDESYDFERMR